MPSLYIIIAGIVLSLALGFAGGYKAKTILVDAEHSKVLKLERQKLIDVREINNSLLADLQEKEIEVKVVTRTINREVIKYVPRIQKVDSKCNITKQSKRLLNELIDPMSPTPRGLTSSDRESSNIRTSDLITNLTINIEKYKIAQARCNALIKWHKDVD